MRWRGSVHKMARLRNSLGADQLTTFRYEHLIMDPQTAAAALAQFVDAPVAEIEVPNGVRETDAWRRLLSPAQLAEIEKVAGQQLRRVGYGDN